MSTRLIDDFKCQCQGGHCEDAILDKDIPGDPRVIVETCGCIFRMSHLGRIVGAALPKKIVNWFQRGQSYSAGYVCPHRDGKISSSFGMNDMIIDQERYMTLWRLANERPADDFTDLTQNPKFTGRFSALPPPELGDLIVEAQEKKVVDSQELSAEFMRRKNALPGRVLACNHERWGIFRKLSFTVRATYHMSVAFFVGYGTTFLKWGRFITEREQEQMLLRDMGERLTPLFLEYYGFRYNPGDYPSRTIEARLWNWILRR